jgi:hypothetical protein
LALTPETLQEAADLVFAARSTFIPAGSTDLLVTPGQDPYFRLLVYLEPERPNQLALDAETRDALDRTP